MITMTFYPAPGRKGVIAVSALGRRAASDELYEQIADYFGVLEEDVDTEQIDGCDGDTVEAVLIEGRIVGTIDRIIPDSDWPHVIEVYRENQAMHAVVRMYGGRQ